MGAPTTQLTSNNTGSITATGESNGFLYLPPSAPSMPFPRVVVGVSGSFTGSTLAIRGKMAGLTAYYGVQTAFVNGAVPIADSTDITLTDNTDQAIVFDASPFIGGTIEIYSPSGTITSMLLEVTANNANAPVLNILNQTVSGTQTYTGATTITVSSANAFVVGPNGTTNPTLQVSTNTASAATGIKATSAAAGSGMALQVISSGTNEVLTIDAKAAALVTIGGAASTALGLQVGSSTSAANATLIVYSSNAAALAVGANGATNPVLKVVASTSSVATGLALTGAAAGSGMTLQVITSGTNEALTIDAAAAAMITLAGQASTATGVTVGSSTSKANAKLIVYSTNAAALSVGPNGATNPTLKVVCSTSSAATGLQVTSAAAAGGVALLVITSGTNENITLDSAGSGTIGLNTVSGTGNVLCGTGVLVNASVSAGGVGYGTGAGGTGTQITSRTTGVTLSKLTGAITLVSAAGSATPFTFTVTNTLITALDTVVVSQKSGTDSYSAVVSTVAAGSFKLTITDLTGTTVEQPVFNYAIIKAVAS